MNAALPLAARRAARTGRRGIAIMEILAAMAVVGIVMTFAAGLIAYSLRAAHRARARSELQRIRDALQDVFLEQAAYPAGLSSLRPVLPVSFRYDNADRPLDPWQEPYEYRPAGRSYSLYSRGPDRLHGDPDADADNIE